MPDAPCWFVIKRDTTGPCETCGHIRETHGVHPEDTPRTPCCAWTGEDPFDNSHCSCEAYLGSRRKRCGHKESEHELAKVLGREDAMHCYFCCVHLNMTVLVAGTNECYHAYEPPLEQKGT